MKILILAAGYGTRLHPLTKHWPKPLLLVKEKPIIAHIIERAQKIRQADEIIIVTNDRHYNFFKNWQKYYKANKRLTILNDKSTTEKNRLGAIGDIQFVIRKKGIKNEDLLVIGGDNLFSFNLGRFVKFARRRKNECCIGLYNLERRHVINRYGVVTLDKQGKVADFREKPKSSISRLVSMCIYYLPKNSLKLVATYLRGKSCPDTPGSYIKWLCKRFPVHGHVLSGVWCDIGDLDSFYNAAVTFKE
ncbi:MAG: nucleotidyltransferase family protein [Candidatus Omnitrophota bacterium]